MHKRFMFFMFLFFLTFYTPQHVHGMQLSKASRTLVDTRWFKSHMHLQKLYAHYKADHSLCETGEVHLYNAQRDKDAVERVAMQHMYALTDLMPSDRVEEQYSDKWDNEVLPTLEDDAVTSKVYRLNDKTVGFVNYKVNEPWVLGRNAMVFHLAMDGEYHGKGYGGKLLSDALSDCQNQGVSCVTLFTRSRYDGKLDKFYGGFGFNCNGGSKYTGTEQWVKRFKPHPMVVLAHMVWDWLCTFKNQSNKD